MSVRRLLCALLAAILLTVPAAANPATPKRPATGNHDFDSNERLLKWINLYRTQPEPARLPEAIQAMSRLGLFLNIDGAGVYVGFIAGVLGKNPTRAERLIASSFPLPPEDQVAVIKAIAFSGLPDWKGVLGAFTERMPARAVLVRHYLFGEGKTLADLPLDEGSFVLDAHWGFYFATGDAEPVRRIVKALEWAKENNNLERLTIGSMAKWTLASNSSRDKELLDILKAEMNVQPDKVRLELREVILAAETFETQQLRKDALAAIDTLKATGPQQDQSYAWWGKAGQTALALGCVAAGALGHVEVGIPCVVGGALSSAALNLFAPGNK